MTGTLTRFCFNFVCDSVYLTEFVDPKHKDLYDEADSPLNAMRIDGKQLDNYDGQIVFAGKETWQRWYLDPGSRMA